MRRASKTPLVSGTLYRNVALLAVGLAVLMALFGGSGDSGKAISLPAARPSDRATNRPGELSQQAAPARFEDSAEPVEPAEPAQAPPSAASPGEAPPLHDGTKLPGARGSQPNAAQPNPAQPNPAQLRHLIEQSRLRSGANPGGD